MKKVLFALALVALTVACAHKPTPEEEAKQKALDAQHKLDSIMTGHVNLDFTAIDSWIAQAKDTTLDGPHREHAFIMLKKYYYDYLAFANLVQKGNGYVIEIKEGYPGIDSLAQMEKDYIKTLWYQKTNDMLYRQSLMVSQLR